MTIVYLARNRVDGDRYIGITTHTVAKRRTQSLHNAERGDDGPFYDSIRRFGIAAFEWAILAEVADHQDALMIERELTRVLRPELNRVFGGGGRAHYLRPILKTEAAAPPYIRNVLPLPAVEEWKAISGYEGLYEVSSHGQVRSIDRIEYLGGRSRMEIRRRKGRIISCKTDKRDGRIAVELSREGKHKTWRVATLVAMMFLGPRPDGMEICHLSDDKNDNKISNIYYGTHRQNCDDRSRNGKTMRGIKATGVKLTESDVLEIKEALASPGTVFQRELAKRYGVTSRTISSIASGKNWAHLK